MSFTVSALSLAYSVASQVAPEGVRVETQVSASDAHSLPLVIVGTSAPSSVLNGPNESSAAFSLSIRCYSTRRAEALEICDSLYGGFVTAWRTGLSTPFGWISRITQDSQQPHLIQSDLEADNVYRFDCVLDVIARH